MRTVSLRKQGHTCCLGGAPSVAFDGKRLTQHLVRKDSLTVVLMFCFNAPVVIHRRCDFLSGLSVPHRIHRISECLSPVTLILR